MNRHELDKFVMTELSPEELGCFNICLYSNPKHAEYYLLYHAGEYAECHQYILLHRGELRLENVPVGSREAARRYIESAKQLKSVDNTMIRPIDDITAIRTAKK